MRNSKAPRGALDLERAAQAGYGDPLLKTPERLLIVAVIERALMDYTCKRVVKGNKWGVCTHRDQEEAEQFIFEETEEPWSLHWCCEHITEDAVGLVETLRYIATDFKERGEEIRVSKNIARKTLLL